MEENKTIPETTSSTNLKDVALLSYMKPNGYKNLRASEGVIVKSGDAQNMVANYQCKIS